MGARDKGSVYLVSKLKHPVRQSRGGTIVAKGNSHETAATRDRTGLARRAAESKKLSGDPKRSARESTTARGTAGRRESTRKAGNM
jgi:hypothetical protein